MNFDFSSEVPLYQQIAGQIEDGILSGAFLPETQIPSTTEFSVNYKINPATVLKGMNLLTDQEILYKKRGLGMFVKEGAAEKILSQRKEQFFSGYIQNLLKEAKKLHISTDEVISMIKEGENDE